MFDEKSRYKHAKTAQLTDSRGRKVQIVLPPKPPFQAIQGFHVLKQGQRLDHLAGAYLNNPTGFWQICEANDAMLPEALSEQNEIAIPTKNR